MTTTLQTFETTRPGRVYAGSTVDIGVVFQTVAGVDTDPTTVTFYVLKPDGGTDTYVYDTDTEVTKSATGRYVARITAAMPGRYYYRWLTTGTGTTVALEGSFMVQRSAFVDDAYALRDYE